MVSKLNKSNCALSSKQYEIIEYIIYQVYNRFISSYVFTHSFHMLKHGCLVHHGVPHSIVSKIYLVAPIQRYFYSIINF